MAVGGELRKKLFFPADSRCLRAGLNVYQRSVCVMLAAEQVCSVMERVSCAAELERWSPYCLCCVPFSTRGPGLGIKDRW